MNKRTWMTAAAVSLGLAVVSWAEGPGTCGGPRDGRRPKFGDFPAPHARPEMTEARRETHELARKVRHAEGEERERLMAELREKVRAETEMVDRLQEERLDAIEAAAKERMAALRAHLAEMREHRDEFVEQEVQRLVAGPRGRAMPPPEGERECGGPEGGWMPPPPEGEGAWMGEGGMPPPPRMGGRGPGRGAWHRGGPGGKPGCPGMRPECRGGEKAPEEAPEGEFPAEGEGEE